MDPVRYASLFLGRELRDYQAEVIRAIVSSVVGRRGMVFSVMFARQMGKNETSAVLEAYLLSLYQVAGGQIVKAAPTYRPQVVISRGRLESMLDRDPMLRGLWRSRYGYQIHVGAASIRFYSGEPTANVVGETASLLLEIDEAQDFDFEKYQKDFRPMASTTNATTVLYGTAWSEDDLLARARRANLEAEARDGMRRHFEYSWTVLAEILPAYRRFVESERERLGASHPLFVTQYELQALAGAGRLLPAAAADQLRGTHSREEFPDPAAVYVAGLDVGGEGAGEHDATVLTVARVSYVQPGGSEVALPALEVVRVYAWRGVELTALQVEVADLLARVWSVSRVCVDGTGIGAGVASYLSLALGERVESVVFTEVSKSEVGYDLIAACTSGRLRYYRGEDAEVVEALRQLVECRRETLPSRRIRWGLEPPDHDDHAVSAGLCVRAALAGVPAAGAIVHAGDVLAWNPDGPA